MEISKTKLEKAKMAAKRHIDGMESAIKQVGMDILTARRDAWLDNQKLEEKIDANKATLEEVFESNKNLNRIAIAQLVFDGVVVIVVLFIAMALVNKL